MTRPESVAVLFVTSTSTPLVASPGFTSSASSTTSTALTRTARTIQPGGKLVTVIRTRPAGAVTSNERSSPTRTAWSGDIIALSNGIAATISGVVSDDACAGSTTMRPLIVDGGSATSRRSLTSSAPTVSFICAVFFCVGVGCVRST